MPLRYDTYNDRIKNWTVSAVSGMKQSGREMGIVHRANSPSPKPSLDGLQARLGRDKAFVVNRVTFSLNRSLVWTHYGAGKGMAANKGTSWINKTGIRVKTDPKSLGKAGTGNRRAKPWFNNYLESPHGVEELADISAEEVGNSVTAKMFN